LNEYNFYNSENYIELYEELEDAFKDNDTETAIEIILDIEQAEINFNEKLPWWYKARWKIGNSEEVAKEARKIYNENIKQF